MAWGEPKLPIVTGSVGGRGWSNSSPYLLEHTPAIQHSCALPLPAEAVALGATAHQAFDAACSGERFGNGATMQPRH